MSRAERGVRAASDARDLCLSLQRAFLGPRALRSFRDGAGATLSREGARTGLGLAWAAGDLELVRAGLGQLPRERVDADPVLATFRAAIDGATA